MVDAGDHPALPDDPHVARPDAVRAVGSGGLELLAEAVARILVEWAAPGSGSPVESIPPAGTGVGPGVWPARAAAARAATARADHPNDDDEIGRALAALDRRGRISFLPFQHLWLAVCPRVPGRPG